MLSEEENCHLVTVTGEEVNNSVKIIPRIAALVSHLFRLGLILNLTLFDTN